MRVFVLHIKIIDLKFQYIYVFMINWLTKYPKDSLVQKAYSFADKAHSGSKRDSGDPYITHCIAVAKTVHDWRLDESSVAGALLHDVVEDTDTTLNTLEKEFGEEVVEIVDGLTKLKRMKYGANPDAENLRKLILSFSKDLRVILIKLADRLHNMGTLWAKPPEKRKEIAWETVEIYAPIAYRLGIQKLSGELEDLAFPHLYPEEYEWLLKNVKEKYEERAAYAEKIKPAIKKMLAEGKLYPISIDSRAKRYYSLYKKLMRYDMDFNKIYDLVALRIIVNSVEECYTTLGIIHKYWTPMQGRFKDYISLPKSNGYRSLHTTVITKDGKIMEIQIRTKEMHEENEFGIAAHWAYEQVKKNVKNDIKNWSGVKNKKELLWVEQLKNWQRSFKNQEDFLSSLKIDFFKERIFVVTPQNDVIDLPSGSTPVDFAYYIHSEIGNQCIGARVNGKIVPIDYELHSGDMVEILTQKGKKPSEDWLTFIKSPMAKKYVKSFVRSKDKKLKKTIVPKGVEFKVIGLSQAGYLKSVTGIFGDAKIAIAYMNSQSDTQSAFLNIVIRCGNIPQERIEKLLVKIKSIQNTKETSAKYIT